MSRDDSSSEIGSMITRFVELKQSLGRGYSSERRILNHLDRFLREQGSKTDLTPEAFALWCSEIDHLTPGVRRRRMRVVRNLCLYRRRYHPACFVPDLESFPQPHQPRRPYFFQ